MKPSRALLVANGALLALLLRQGSSAAADIPPALQEVKRWRLTFNYEETAVGKEQDWDWKLNINASGSALLEKTDDPFGKWTGTPDVSVSYSYVGYQGTPMCYTEESVMSSGGLVDVADSAHLQFFADGYQIEPAAHNVMMMLQQTNACPDAHEVNVSGQRYWYQHAIISDSIPYPDGLELSGTLTDDTHRPNVEQTIGDLDLATTHAVLSYQLTPELDPLVLEIDDSGAYETWRPSVGDASGNPGEPITINVQLKSESGGKPTVKVRKFTWALTGTSREPGFSMNYPIDADDDEPDLKLEGSASDGQELSDEDQRLEHLLVTPATTDQVQIRPYDWGAWSTLRVTALLEDGRTIVGKAKSSKEEDLRLPKRAEDSYIADVWKKQERASGDDYADDDQKPDGDGNHGDGLSLYEEYRGFYQKGEHLEGDPTAKDLFVLTAQAARPGVAHFAKLSKLAVHMYLRGSELPPSRVINANRSGGPSVTDQHALRVVISEEQPAATEHVNLLGRAVGGPGTPKDVLELRLMSGWAALPLADRNQVVAHELFHAVNVYHHGEVDEPVVAWGLNEEGELVEGRPGAAAVQPIHVFRERVGNVDDEVMTLLNKAGKPLLGWLGKDGGQHSGNDACVMRYFVAGAYEGNPDATRRYITSERFGAGLCSDPSGSGVNDPGRDPQSRFGAAAENRGDCTHQVLVSDAVDAPSR